MSTKTGIEWTDATWNPIAGCNDVSEGCRNCYARTMAKRLEAMGSAKYAGLTVLQGSKTVWTGKIAFDEKALLDPLSEKKPTRYFVNSMSDLFHENVTDEMLDRIFAVMALCPQHTFQVLTKRAQRMADYMDGRSEPGCEGLRGAMVEGMTQATYAKLHPEDKSDIGMWLAVPWPLPNVQLGVSVENQKAEERISLLLQTPAAVRFISAEPLIDLLWIAPYLGTECCHGDSYVEADTNATICRECEDQGVLDWVIVGGESGPGARPMHPDWARSLRDQCVAAGVPFFFKQWGEWTPGENVTRNYGRVRGAGLFGGKWLFSTENLTEGHSAEFQNEPELYRVGKKAAGRLLDGREWNEVPR